MEVFDNLKKELFIYKFQNEIDYLENCHFGNNDVRIDKLKKIIEKYTKKDYGEEKKSRENFFDDVIKAAYLKKWNRLTLINKKNRIKQYVDNLIQDKSHNKKIINKLNILLEKKKINAKNIDYDYTIGKINDINILKFNKEDNSFFISK
jgi:hypothetical protein